MLWLLACVKISILAIKELDIVVQSSLVSREGCGLQALRLPDCDCVHAHVCSTIVPWRSFVGSTSIYSVRAEIVLSVTQAVFTANTIEDKSIC